VKASSNVFEFRPEGSVPVSLAYQSEEVPVAEEIPPEFGDAGSVRVQVGATGAYDFDDVTMALARTSVSLFIIKGLSLDLEADFGYLGQSEGEDGVGVGFTMLTRWHFLRRETWSLYGEVGIGLFFSSVDVPVGGGQINFNPQAGGGVSFEVARDVRMMLGMRWTHLSNARTLASNPGVDALGIYAMVSFGF
jgi:hypothetical protein